MNYFIIPGIVMEPTPKNIISAVCKVCNVTPAEMISADRHRHISEARQIACSLMRASGMTLSDIGTMLGGREHSSVYWAINAHRALMRIYPQHKQRYENLKYQFRWK